jgi:Ty3 transposon capsid-like protein
MAPAKNKNAAPRNNPPAPRPSEDPEDLHGSEDADSQDDNGRSDTPPPNDPEAELARLREALTTAQNLIAALQQASSAAPAVSVHEPKVNKPTEFSGKLSEYSTFISQCLLTFTMCPMAYQKDEQKVLFVISYLGGTPRRWANRILQGDDHPFLKDFNAFKEALDAMYSDRNLKQKARDKLGKLEQVRSVAAYSAEFQEAVMPLDLKDDGLMPMFYKGLDDEIKKALIYFPEAKTFKELVDQCVSIDQRQYAVRKELKTAKKSSAPQSKPPGSNSDSSKQSGNFRNSSHSGNSGNSRSYDRPGPYSRSGNSSRSGHLRGNSQSSSNSKQGPSSRPRGPISDDERNRRRENNLCFGCGSPDHMIVDCPLNKKATSSNVYAARPSTPAPEYALPLPQENWLSQDVTRPTS